jgi:tetratricopeptide (TPR) repeat protein
MSEKSREAKKDCLLYLVGPFALTDAQGRSVCPKAQKSRAVIAMLALSPRGSRSRVWMRDKLWSDRGEDQASASLRQALLDIRKSLGPDLRDILNADKHTVSLDLPRLWIDVHEILDQSEPLRETTEGSLAAEHFLEGIDVRDPEFEEWLMMERQVWQRRIDQSRHSDQADPSEVTAEPTRGPARSVLAGLRAAASQGDGSAGAEMPPPALPPEGGNGNAWSVALLPPICVGENEGSGFLSGYVEWLLTTSLVESGDIAVSDFTGSDLFTPGRGETGATLLSTPLAVQTRLVFDDHSALVTIVVMRSSDRSIQWSGMRSVPRREIAKGDATGVNALVNNAVEEIARYFFRCEAGEEENHQARLVAVANSMFRLSRGDLDRAEATLRHLLRARPSSQAHAWLAFLNTFRVGQRFASQDANLIEEAQYNARRALEFDSNNPITLALVGHVHSFLLGEYDFAAALFERALRLNPAQTLAWDLYAMLHAYVGEPHKAHAMARWARELGAHSAYRYYFDTTKAISASLAGDHQAAIAAGEAALRDRPNFNSILRYLVSSHAHLGNLTTARELLHRLEQVEPEFTIEGLYASRYPTLQTAGGKSFVAGLVKAGARKN